MHEVSNPWPNFPDEPAYVLDIDQPSVDDWNQYVRRQQRFNTDAVHEVELGAFYMGTHQVWSFSGGFSCHRPQFTPSDPVLRFTDWPVRFSQPQPAQMNCPPHRSRL